MRRLTFHKERTHVYTSLILLLLLLLMLAYSIFANDPTLTAAILNATNSNNNTQQNLTAYPQGPSSDTNSYVYDWRINGVSEAIVNMPMANTSIADRAARRIPDFSTYGSGGTIN